MDSEPVDLANDGVKLGNATEQNEKGFTEISKDNHDKEMTEKNFHLKEIMSCPTFHRVLLNQLIYLMVMKEEVKQKKKTQPKRVKKEKEGGNRKLKVHHLRKLKGWNQCLKNLNVNMLIVMCCCWKKRMLENNELIKKLCKRLIWWNN